MEDRTECQYFNAVHLKVSSRGSSLIEMILITGFMVIITVGALSLYQYAKEYYGPPQHDAIVANQNIVNDKHKNDTVQKYAANGISARTINQTTEQPKEVLKPEPIIEKVTENHYHFEALSSGLKYLGVIILGLFAVFTLRAAFKFFNQVLIIKKAEKQSKRIIMSFDNDFGDQKKQLIFTHDMADQIIVNNILIDSRKNKERITTLIVHNEKLKERLSFLESKLVNRYGRG